MDLLIAPVSTNGKLSTNCTVFKNGKSSCFPVNLGTARVLSMLEVWSLLNCLVLLFVGYLPIAEDWECIYC